MAAILPHEWAELFDAVTQACITQSPRQLRADLAARDAELTEANRRVAFWQQSSAEWKASRERLDAELARVREELAIQQSANRALGKVAEKDRERAKIAEAERDALLRGEFICRKCGLRKDGECPPADF